jgi:hypothetical protein
LNDIVQLGPLVLNRKLLILIVALICGWGAIRLRRRAFGEAAASALELVLNAGLIVLLFWKFGHALFAPALLWQRPQSLLLMSGAAREVGLGLLAAAAFAAYRARRQGLPLRLLLDLLAFGATAALAAHSLLQWRYGSLTEWPWGIRDGYGYEHFHPLNGYMFLVSLLAGIRLWRKAGEGEAGTGRMFQEAALVIGVGGMLVSFADAPGHPFLFYLSAPQLMYLGLAVVGVIFPIMRHNTGRKELTAMTSNKEHSGDSLEQREQERENASSTNKDEDGLVIDKKLDGPNRPST